MTPAAREGHDRAMLVYKILRAGEWRLLRAAGETEGSPADRADGFVHFSTAEQLAETAAKHFAGEAGLIVAAVESDNLDALRWEPSRGGALFPHLHRPLRLADLVWARPVDAADLPIHVDPTRSQFDAFKALPRDRPVEMLNLVRFRDTAGYPPEHPDSGAGLTGAEAYSRYGAATAPVLRRVGGEIAWRGRFEVLLIGPAAERWDALFVARYPSAGAFLAMVTDPEYRTAVVHRQAAVTTSRLIRCAPAEPGGGFA